MNNRLSGVAYSNLNTTVLIVWSRVRWKYEIYKFPIFSLRLLILVGLLINILVYLVWKICFLPFGVCVCMRQSGCIGWCVSCKLPKTTGPSYRPHDKLINDWLVWTLWSCRIDTSTLARVSAPTDDGPYEVKYYAHLFHWLNWGEIVRFFSFCTAIVAFLRMKPC